LLFYHLTPGKDIDLNEVKIKTELINKNQRSVGYRVNWREYSVAYVTDLNDNFDSQEKERILNIIQNADLMVANATYNPPTSKNHECAELLWKTPVDLAICAGVKQLIISHHHPDDHDDFLDKVQADIQSVFPQASLACEGHILSLA
jgi:phosphoribosyl 1,2-cyclic phosphodiesterase